MVSLPLGNVAERPLADVLAQAQIEAQYTAHTHLPAACRACAQGAVCGGGRRGYARLYTGDWPRPDSQCPVAKRNLRTGCISGNSEQVLDA